MNRQTLQQLQDEQQRIETYVLRRDGHTCQIRNPGCTQQATTTGTHSGCAHTIIAACHHCAGDR